MKKLSTVEELIKEDILEETEFIVLPSWEEFYKGLSADGKEVPKLAQINAFDTPNLKAFLKEAHLNCIKCNHK